MATSKAIKLTLEASNVSSRPFADVSKSIDDLTDKLGKQTEAATRGQVTAGELATTLGKLKDAQGSLISSFALAENYQKLATQLTTAREKALAASTAFQTLKAGADTTTLSASRYAAQLGRAEKASVNAATAVANLEKRVEDAGVQLESLGANINDLVGFQDRLSAKNAELATTYTRGQDALENYDATIRAHRAALAEATAASKADQAALAAAAASLAAITRLRDEAAAAALKGAQAASLAAQQIENAAAKEAEAAARAEYEENERERELNRKAAEAARQARADELARQAEILRINEERQARYTLNKEIDASYQIKKRENEESKEFNRLAAESRARLQELEAEERKRNAGSGSGSGSEGGKKSGLGFDNTELTNLAYRAKDIADQLGSGAGFARVIAQQGSAVVLDFKNQLSGLATFIPEIVAGAAALALLAAGLYRLDQTVESERRFNAELKATADGAKYSATALTEQQRQIQRLGPSFDEAGKAIETFISAGLNGEKIDAFSKASVALSRVYGVQLPEAAKLTSEAFTHGYAAVAELDDKFNFLTRDQAAAIHAMFESGDAAKAQSVAFGIFADKLGQASEQAKGPFSEAILKAKNAYADFIDAFAKNGILESFAQTLGRLADSAGRFASGLRDAQNVQPVDKNGANTTDLSNQIDALKAERKGAEKIQDYEAEQARAGDPGASDRYLVQRQHIEELTQQIQRLKISLKDLDDASPEHQAALRAEAARTAALNSENERREKIGDRLLRQAILERENLKTDLPGREKIAGETAYDDALAAGSSVGKAEKIRQEAIAKVRDQAAIENRRREEGLENAFEGILAKGDRANSDSLAARLKAVDETYDKINAKIQDFQARGGSSIEGMSIPDYKAAVEAQKEVLKQEETQKYYEEELTKLTSQREAIYKDINDRVKAGQLTAAAGFKEAVAENAKIAPQMKRIADDAVRFGEALLKAKPGADAQAFLDKAKQGQRDSTGTSSAASGGSPINPSIAAEGDKAASAALEEANKIIAERNDLQKAYNVLVQDGVMTQAEAEKKLKQDYADSNKALTTAIANAKALLAALKGIVPGSQLNLLNAQLTDISAKSQYVSESFKKTREEIIKAVGEDVAKSVENLANVFGKVIAGQESLKQGFKDAGLALEQFVASFLTSIAQILLKKEEEVLVDELLKALESHSGGVVGPGGGGVQRPVEASWFAGAPRYHSGGVVGLQPNEQAAILKHGEEVLTGNDPRNVLNGGKSRKDRAPALNVRHVLVMDPDLIPQAMKGQRGEQTTLSHIKANLPTIRQMLGVSPKR